MNDFLLHAALGSVQGLTEFLPVSSSGHLYLLQNFLGLTPSLSLEIWLHVASLLAVVFLYKSEIIRLLKEIPHWNTKAGFLLSDAAKLAFSTLLTFPLAYLLDSQNLLELSLPLVGFMLIVTGALVFVSYRRFSIPRTHFQPISWQIAGIVGLAQAVAVLPGLSRSGVTIAVLLLLGVQGQNAVRYSFLLSIPTILASLGYITLKNGAGEFTFSLLLAVLASFGFSFFTIKWLKGLTPKKWLLFVPYCLILGLALLLL